MNLTCLHRVTPYRVRNRFIFFTGVLLFVMQATHSVSQTGVVTGKVMDATTMEALPFAHVFINQTTIGTVTDARGHYTLENVPVGEQAMVFSFVGYTSYQTKIQMKDSETKQLDIRLQSYDKELETVEVKGTRDKEWEKQEKKFEKVFLGTSKFAESAKILNPWVLDFKEIKTNGKGAFMATASMPIEIENRALGYRVFYYLQDMISNSAGFMIRGQIRFEVLTTEDVKTTEEWKHNRMEVYKGSLRHLLVSLIESKVEEQGFDLYTHIGSSDDSWSRTRIFTEQLNKSMQAYSYRNSVTPGKTDGEFIIQVEKRLEIHFRPKYSSVKIYNDVTSPVSWLEVKEGYLRANSKGIVLNPPAAIVSGAMYEDRVAHMLPYNYSPD